jgi:hypothetical protein
MGGRSHHRVSPRGPSDDKQLARTTHIPLFATIQEKERLGYPYRDSASRIISFRLSPGSWSYLYREQPFGSDCRQHRPQHRLRDCFRKQCPFATARYHSGQPHPWRCATIILPALPPGSFYTLEIPASGSDDETTGDLNINAGVSIIGGDATTTVIDANRGVTHAGVFRIDDFRVTVNMTGLTASNGESTGHIANGGIVNFGTLTLTSSTVRGNIVSGSGGGIENAGGALTLINNTVSGNTAKVGGGGIWNQATANVLSSTIAENRADFDFNGAGTGGGVFNSSCATFSFQNTVIAENFEGLTRGDCSVMLSPNGNNLMEVINASHCTVAGAAPIVADPKLDSLQNNGGPTQTYALLAGSPAIDAGDSLGCRDNLGALLTTDQRGFRRTVDGNHDGSSRCDIRAVEFGSRAGVPVSYDLAFDGDGKTDPAVYRDGTWFILRSFDGGVTATGWGGLPQDLPLNHRND